MPRPPTRSTLFPYTTLFRSAPQLEVAQQQRPDPHPTQPLDRAADDVEHAPHLPLASCARVTLAPGSRSEEHTSELQSRLHLVCRLLLEKKKSSSTVFSKCVS